MMIELISIQVRSTNFFQVALLFFRSLLWVKPLDNSKQRPQRADLALGMSVTGIRKNDTAPRIITRNIVTIVNTGLFIEKLLIFMVSSFLVQITFYLNHSIIIF